MLSFCTDCKICFAFPIGLYWDIFSYTEAPFNLAKYDLILVLAKLCLYSTCCLFMLSRIQRVC